MDARLGTNTCVDCANKARGASRRDKCGTCDGDPANDCRARLGFGIPGGWHCNRPPRPCTRQPNEQQPSTHERLCTPGSDCAGVWGGPARLDKCNQCNGDGTTCSDCANVTVNGKKGPNRKDDCGVCDANVTNDCRADCRAVWGGSAMKDNCNVCQGSNACVAGF